MPVCGFDCLFEMVLESRMIPKSLYVLNPLGRFDQFDSGRWLLRDFFIFLISDFLDLLLLMEVPDGMLQSVKMAVV